MTTYTINTVEELFDELDRIMELDPELFEEYSVLEIIEDGITMGEVNPALKTWEV